MKKSRKTTAVIVALIAVLIIGFTTYQLAFNPKLMERTSGTALIGGEFAMLDHNAKLVTSKDFHGKYMLIYFGYTFCPDICPTELQVMSGALEILGDKAKKIQPVFVSVDPDRDTPEVMKEYVSNFYPGMIGLTGSKEQVLKIAKLYRVYYSKVSEKGSDADDYAVDHTSIVYLMGPDGSFVKHFSYGTDAKKLADGIKAATKG